MRSLAAHTWLILRNDLRLLWRDMLTGKLRLFSSVGFLVFILIVLHGMSLLVFGMAKQPPPLTAETIAWFFIGFVMFGTAMNHAISVLFERADFDLLLPSPVSPRAILLARWATMTVGAAASSGIFVVPILNGIAIGQSTRYFCGYAVWILGASFVASAGVWATLLLVRWLGARRARTWAQVIAALLGASIYLLFQGQNLLPREMRAEVAAKVSRTFDHPTLSFVAQAGRGDLISLLLLLFLAVAFALVTNRVLARLFITGIQEAGGVATSRRPIGRHAWATGLIRATFWKDLRLIARDPLLLSKVLPTTLYLLPVVFAVKGVAKTGIPGLLAPFAVFATGMMSNQLAIIATAGEEGWDLIRMSGTSTVRLRIAKIAASMALPMTLCLALVLAIAVLGRPGLALLTLIVAVVCTGPMCWVEVAHIRPTPRKDLLQAGGRIPGGFSALRIITGAVFFLGGATTVVLAANQKWIFASVAGSVVLLTAIACVVLVEPRDVELG